MVIVVLQRQPSALHALGMSSAAPRTFSHPSQLSDHLRNFYVSCLWPFVKHVQADGLHASHLSSVIRSPQ